jgi:hypothetical protein
MEHYSSLQANNAAASKPYWRTAGSVTNTVRDIILSGETTLVVLVGLELGTLSPQPIR